MVIVVTGGTGLLGPAVLRRLGRGHEVVALYRPGSAPVDVRGVRWIEEDLKHPCYSELPERVDAVVHLAQSRQFREFPNGAVDVFEVNTAATVRLLRYCWEAQGTRFIYASSGAVYAPGFRPVREYDVPKPPNFYAMSKLVAEQAVDQFRDLLTALNLRFFFIYGPGQREMLVPRLIEAVRTGIPIPLAGEKGIRINPIYVDDAAAAVEAALRSDRSGTFNVAGPEVIPISRIAELIGEAVGVTPSFTHGPVQPDLIGDIEQMREHLVAPQTPLRQGLEQTIGDMA